ncbi:MAG TPA: transaldolase family protein [Candidatus Synoicihabitans sp.]|nr:transaldolase family protein [Candidatus Synoicihabitans sp.]
MKIWLATADLKLIEEYFPYGLFAGVITNPHVVAEAQRPPVEFFREVCRLAPAAYYQLREASAADMLAEAEKFIAIDPQKMRIKVPATPAGLQTIRALANRGHEVMATVVPTTAWLVFALAAGARTVAPYGSMLQRRGLASKLDEVIAMQRIIDAQRSSVDLCVGIYDPTEFSQYAREGIRSCFVWGRDVPAFLNQPLVDEALQGFAGDWKAIEQY